MKIMRIGKDKIKIILSEEEMIKQKKFLVSSKDVGIFIEYLVREIEKHTGIVIKNCNCLVKGFQSEEGFVIYVIDISSEDTNCKVRSSSNRLIFDINSAENLLLLLKSLNEKLYEKMRIYRYGSHFFVSVPRFPIPIHMCEFSLKWRKGRIAESILSEHGKLIAKNEQVVQMAKEIKKYFT